MLSSRLLSILIIFACHTNFLLEARDDYGLGLKTNGFLKLATAPNAFQYNDYLLLSNQPVAVDLSLNESQQIQIDDIRFALIRESQKVKQGYETTLSVYREDKFHPPMRWPTLKDLQSDFTSRFQTQITQAGIESHRVLTEQQVTRLGQIKLHLLNNSLFQNPQFCEALQITDDQLNRIGELFDGMKKEIITDLEAKQSPDKVGLTEDHTLWNLQAFDRAVSLLSKRQQLKLYELLGERPEFGPHDLKMQFRVEN